jgi:hypothetical protein
MSGDLETLEPRLEAVRTVLDSEMNQRIGLLTLFVVPLTMMQAVLAIMQTGWTVAQSSIEQASPLWRTLGIAPALLSLLILAALVPGIWWSLRIAQTHRRMREVKVAGVVIAVLVFLVFLLMVIVAVSV